MEHAIVGFEPLGDPVLGGEFVPFEDGLNVLYGLNGAGKTRLLMGIQNSLLGIQSDIRVGLVARVHEPSASDVDLDEPAPHLDRGQRCSGAGLLIALANSIGGRSEKTHRSRNSSELEYTLPAAFNVVREHLRSELEPYDPSIPVEIPTEELQGMLLNDRLFILLPTGTKAAPQWQAWPVADRRHPVVMKWEQRWVDLLDMPDDEDEYAELIERLCNVGLDEAGAVGNSAGSVEGFRGYRMATSSGGKIFSRSYVFISNHAEADDVPSITLNGPIDFGVDLVSVDIDAEEATLELLDRTSIKASLQNLGYGPYWLNADSRTMHALVEKEDISGRGAEAVEGTESAERIAGDLAKEVNTILSSVLLEPPTASIRFAQPLLRFSTPAAQWVFRATDASAVGITSLSTAERRWATIAIGHAIAKHNQQARYPNHALSRRIVLLIDEPEAALHRAAEARAADFLLQWSRDPRCAAFVATHSPELLDIAEASLFEISKLSRGIPTSHVQPLDLADREALLRLGLRPSDLLRWPRIFLLVEGEHDRQMIESYFGPRLRKARVELLPMRGAKQLASTIDSRVLFQYTDATVVALLDNLAADALNQTWQDAQLARMTDGIVAAQQILLDWFKEENTEEARYMSGWLTSALAAGFESRLLPYGLSARDVIEYLPASEMVPGAMSWEALHREHQSDRAEKKGHPNEFKPWLKARKNIEISEDRIRDALVAAPHPPADLEQMMKTLEALSSEPRARRSANGHHRTEDAGI